jgi:hypothetical protein
LPYDVDDISVDFGSVVDYTGYHLIYYLSGPIRRSSLKLRSPLILADVITDHNAQYINVTPEMVSIFNLVWADFFASANAGLIVRIILVEKLTGLASPFTSYIIHLDN